MRITKKIMDTLEPATGFYKSGKPITHHYVWDDELKGFGAKITNKGQKSFVFRYRNSGGQEKLLKIGEYPEWATSAARDRAKELRRLVDKGQDPLGEKQAERAAPTVADLCQKYEDEHLPEKRESSAAEDRRQIRLYVLPKWRNKKVAEITRQDVKRLHKSLADMPYRANRLLALLSKMFNMAVTEWGMRPDNPCKGVPRFPEVHRERFLSQQEIARLSEVLAEWPNQTVAAAVRFLLLSGARKSEVINMTWDQIDFERRRWTKPSHHTKQKRQHVVPLSPPALQILAERPRDSERVFPGLGSINHAWQKIRKQAGLDGVRVHDLRHSTASILASKGMSLTMIGAVLGHTQVQTTAKYAHLADQALQDAVDAVGDVVEEAGKPAGKPAGKARG